jgi:predicted transcriptional regulator
MAKVNVAFRFDSVLYRKFRKIARERGRTMTWYLEACMRGVVKRKSRK